MEKGTLGTTQSRRTGPRYPSWLVLGGLMVGLGACRTPPEPPPDRTDKDLDGFLDRYDGCPSKPETYNNNRDWDGCPDPDKRRVRVVNGQIALPEPVKFATGSNVILKESLPLLQEVQSVMTELGQTKVRILGHTDNKGNPVKNLSLSQRRAEAVMAYLATQGVDRDLMTAEGKGHTLPLVTNDTEEGRTQNRRVEFHIVKP